MTTKANPFLTIQPWLQGVLEDIKRDIKTDYLPADPIFFRTYFGNRPQNRLAAAEIFSAYEKELLKGNDEMAEWVVNRWVFKHGDLYRHFADRLGQIRTDFGSLQTLTKEESFGVLQGAAEAFGPADVYLFSILNEVVFPPETMQELRQAAEAALTAQEIPKPQETPEAIIQRQQKEIAKLQEKYEDKLIGVRKKYDTDVEALKKQIRALQKRLDGSC